MADDTQQVQRAGMVWFIRENFAVQPFGRAALTALMKE